VFARNIKVLVGWAKPADERSGVFSVLFLTRELYGFIQRPDVPWDVKERRWRAAVEALWEHHVRIRPRLPESMRAFSGTTLHDGVIRVVRRPSAGEVILEIDGRGCAQEPRGLFTLAFRGVKEEEGLNESVGAAWLYEEVHLHAEAGFDYRVLVGRGIEVSEVRVVADEVEFRVIERGLTPVVGIDFPVQGEDGLYVWTDVDEAGGRQGWCLIADGKKVAKEPAPEVLERMRRFARGIGAKVAGEEDPS
jgi:hypothetical protein